MIIFYKANITIVGITFLIRHVKQALKFKTKSSNRNWQIVIAIAQ